MWEGVETGVRDVNDPGTVTEGEIHQHPNIK